MADKSKVIFGKFHTTEKTFHATEKNLPTAREFYLLDDSGEIHDRWVEDPRAEKSATDWSRGKDEAIGQVALKWRSYSPAMYGMLLYLVSRMRWGGYVPITQAVLAEELGMSSSMVSKALKRLTQDKVLLVEKDPALPKGKAYKLNANFAFKGKALRWRSARGRDGGIR